MATLNENQRLLEAILFISSEPVDVRDLVALLGMRSQEIEKNFQSLQAFYVNCHHGLAIRKVAGGWQMTTVNDLADILESYNDDIRRRKIRLSKAALECLAITAYNQPVTRSEIEDIRGVRSERVIDTLLSHGLLRIAGRGKGTGSPLLYRTTDKFLELFGLNAVSDLPTMDELEELFGSDYKGRDGIED
jgi:segregation and condensation protein B